MAMALESELPKELIYALNFRRGHFGAQIAICYAQHDKGKRGVARRETPPEGHTSANAHSKNTLLRLLWMNVLLLHTVVGSIDGNNNRKLYWRKKLFVIFVFLSLLI